MIVRLMGGLGNCLFCYAFGRAVALVRDEELFFTRWHLGKNDGSYTERAYGLDAFNTIEMKFVPHEVGSVMWEGNLPFSYHPEVFTAMEYNSFVGCWQSEKYFAAIASNIRSELTLKNPPSNESLLIADQIASAGASAFLHIRRGDYLKPDAVTFHGSPTMQYYKDAIERIMAHYQQVKFFVFSDDPEWCRAAFPDFTVVGHNKPSNGIVPGKEHEDIWLMSQCRHAIIANSSFSWWGAWLGDLQPHRLVFAPKRWFAELGPKETQDIVPNRWVKLAS